MNRCLPKLFFVIIVIKPPQEACKIHSLEKEKDEAPLPTEIGNDPDGRPLSMRYPFGRVSLRYEYDTSGKLKRLTNTRDNVRMLSVDPNNAYDEMGHLLREYFGDGTNDGYTYYPNSKRLGEIRSPVTFTEL